MVTDTHGEDLIRKPLPHGAVDHVLAIWREARTFDIASLKGEAFEIRGPCCFAKCDVEGRRCNQRQCDCEPSPHIRLSGRLRGIGGDSVRGAAERFERRPYLWLIGIAAPVPFPGSGVRCGRARAKPAPQRRSAPAALPSGLPSSSPLRCHIERPGGRSTFRTAPHRRQKCRFGGRLSAHGPARRHIADRSQHKTADRLHRRRARRVRRGSNRRGALSR